LSRRAPEAQRRHEPFAGVMEIMRSKMTAFALVAVVSLLAGVAEATKYSSQALLSQATDKAVDQLLSSLTASPKLRTSRRVTVARFVGDQNGLITRTVTTALTSTSLEVFADTSIIEGVVIPKVASEMKLADLMDDKTKTGLKLAHVQALLIGWVEEATADINTGSRVRLTLNLVEVETSRLLWGASATGEVVIRKVDPAPYVIVCAAALLLILIIVIRARIRAPKPETPGQRIDHDRNICERMLRDLKTARRTLTDTQSAARDANAQALAQAAQNAVDKVVRLSDDINNSPSGTEEGVAADKEKMGALAAHDTLLERSLREIIELADHAKNSVTTDAERCAALLAQLGDGADQLRLKVDERRNLVS